MAMAREPTGGDRETIERYERCRRRFSRRLRRAVAAAGYRSLGAFATSVGIAPSTLTHWLDQQRSLPSIWALLRVTAALGVTSDWLLGADDDEQLRGILRAREIDGEDPIGGEGE